MRRSCRWLRRHNQHGVSRLLVCMQAAHFVFLATAAMAGSIPSNFHTPSATAFGIGREPDTSPASAQKLPGYTHACLRLLHLRHVPTVVQHHQLGV